jgi:nucleotide-binding universal stress UspA family protein
VTIPTAQGGVPALSGLQDHSDLRADEHHLRHVVVCLDRSPLAETCLPHARALVDAFGAKLELFHVVAPPDGDEPPVRLDALDWEISRREAEDYLSRIRAELEQAGVPRDQLTTDVTQGRPAARIVTRVREVGADLVVLGSHGKSGVGAWSLGSTAQQVLALAPASVLVVKPDPDRLRRVPPKRIMVAVDGSLRAESVLPQVAQLAEFHRAAVLLVHVVPEPMPTAVLSDEEALELARRLASRLRARAEAYLSQLGERFFGASRVETEVLRHPNDRRALLEAANRLHADLLVLAAHGVTCDAETPFGSVTAYSLAHSALSLLVLQVVPSIERESRRPTAIGEEAPIRARAPFGARPLGDT